ncbi:hypothetical protein JTB14_017295 [Gonioctena quinquepunctata]|nr:hypothetical protein JTB14_017295 [Gonioctena quinquepunctata]
MRYKEKLSGGIIGDPFFPRPVRPCFIGEAASQTTDVIAVLAGSLGLARGHIERVERRRQRRWQIRDGEERETEIMNVLRPWQFIRLASVWLDILSLSLILVSPFISTPFARRCMCLCAVGLSQPAIPRN